MDIMSPSPRKAWIETQLYVHLSNTSAASPSPRKAWIETVRRQAKWSLRSSPSPRKAWIETAQTAH